MTANISLPKRFVQRINETNAAETEVVVDAVLSKGTTDFVQVGPSTSGIVVNQSSAHMNAKTPMGGNILFLDGHASWRNFAGKKMQNWYYADTGKNIYFWF